MRDGFELIKSDGGRLVLKRPGQEDVADVRIRRAFPWSNARHFISIRSGDGKELVLVENLDQLSPAQAKLIEESLADRSFIPKITRIDQLDTTFGFQHWKVQTDRGPAEFRVQEREDVRFLPDGRFSVKDADGNIYELPRIEDLDEKSRRAIEKLV